LIYASTGLAHADQVPLWEAGAGLSVIRLADYRGSNEYHNWVLPVPYLVYHGDFLKADERRIRGQFFQYGRVEVDLSFFGAPPARNNEARQGMPDLDATLEVGPAINVTLLRSEDGKESLELRLPVRTAIALNLPHTKNIGWIFQPNLNLDVHDVFGRGWDFGVLGGPLYTDRSYNQYFYGVDPAFANAERPAFNPSGGYAGTQFIASLSRRYGRLWVGGFAKWDSVRGAVFADSPLVKSQQDFSGGLAVSWVFSKSPTTVEAGR
jgi:outer membrane scaffolding protein for murein synthesis (MipA/OmpV family)